MVWYFIGVYKINRTLHGRLEIRNFFSCVEECFTRSLRSLVKFRISERPCNILYLLFTQNIGSNPRLIPHNPLALTIFGRRKQYTINREEKSLRHVVMVAKFLDDNKPNQNVT